jgi:hypothetical protein
VFSSLTRKRGYSLPNGRLVSITAESRDTMSVVLLGISLFLSS